MQGGGGDGKPGEGNPNWGDPGDARLRAAILAAAERHGPSASFCPSAVARDLAADWRPLMPRIRAVAAALQREGLLRVTQRGRPVPAAAARGPIRLSKPAE